MDGWGRAPRRGGVRCTRAGSLLHNCWAPSLLSWVAQHKHSLPEMEVGLSFLQGCPEWPRAQEDRVPEAEPPISCS